MRIGMHESFDMCRLAPMPWASCHCVPVFDVEATRVIRIPICVFLYHVQMGRVIMLWVSPRLLEQGNAMAPRDTTMESSTAAVSSHVVSHLGMYRTKVLMYRTMVLLARLTKVRC